MALRPLVYRFYHFRNVPMIQQSKMQSCWYASAQMVFNSFVDGPLPGMLERNDELLEQGLLIPDAVAFAQRNSLLPMFDTEPSLMTRALRNNGFVFDDLVYMLSTYGPLWAPTLSLLHICTLTGVEENDSGVWITYNDPMGGAVRSMSLLVFNDRRLFAPQTRGLLLHYNGGRRGITNKPGRHRLQMIRPTIGVHKLHVDIPGQRTTNHPVILPTL